MFANFKDAEFPGQFISGGNDGIIIRWQYTESYPAKSKFKAEKDKVISIKQL